MAKKKVMYCSFCGRTEAQGATLLPSPTDDACICVDCIETAASMLGMVDPDDEQQGAVARARAKSRIGGNQEVPVGGCLQPLQTPRPAGEHRRCRN